MVRSNEKLKTLSIKHSIRLPCVTVAGISDCNTVS